MRNCIFSGRDLIAVLNFLAKFKDACNINKILEQAAMWCIQFYVAGQAEPFLLSHLTGNSVAIDARKYEMLHSYLEVVNFLLRRYATSEVIAEADNGAVVSRESFSII